MSEIPADIMNAAREAIASYYDKEGERDFADRIRKGQKDDWWMTKPVAIAILAERERSRTALSEAEQQVQDAKRIATNAEHYGYLHGLEKAAVIADEHAKTWGLANGSPAKVISAAIRALIPSEPHDAEGAPPWQDSSIFDDAEGRN